MKKFIICVILLLNMPFAQAATLPEDIRQVLAKPAPTKGSFTQKKNVQGFNAPIRSSGSFLLVPGKGLLWTTEQPFASEIRITRDKLEQTSQGMTTLSLDARQQPALRVMNQVMFRLLSGDVHALDADFMLSGAINKGQWQIHLQAKNPALGKVLQQITLRGGKYVNTIRILEANGDSTDITLSAQKEVHLSPDEVQRFE